MKTINHWTKESGASMVSVMVAMGLFAVVAVMASQSFRNISTSSRKVEGAMSAREVESVVVQAVVNRYKTFVLEKCVKNPAAYFDNFDIGSLATAYDKKVKFYGVDRNVVTPPPKMAEADVTRCTGTPFSTDLPPKSDTFYGCYNLDTKDAVRIVASADAFAANRGAFIETFVRLRNLQTDTLVDCEMMQTARGMGLEVYYSLHWATPSGEATLYDSKTGSLNVAL